MTGRIIGKSFKAVNRAALFVLLYYLFYLFAAVNRIYEPHILVSILLLGLYFVVQCGTLGIISKIIEAEKISFKSFIESIKTYFFKYICALIGLFLLMTVCFIPYFIFAINVKGGLTMAEFAKTKPSYIISNLSNLLLAILSVYIFPFVFNKGKGVDAVIGGIIYLFKNLRKSMLLIVMTIIKNAIAIFVLGFALEYPYKSWKYIQLISVNSIFSIYIELAIFAWACYILRNSAREKNYIIE